jgi:hypothetical protein
MDKKEKKEKKSKDDPSEKSESSAKDKKTEAASGPFDPLSQLKNDDERKAFTKVQYPSIFQHRCASIRNGQVVGNHLLASFTGICVIRLVWWISKGHCHLRHEIPKNSGCR